MGQNADSCLMQILCIGDSASGKTGIFNAVLNGKPVNHPTRSTLGVDVGAFNTQILDCEIVYQLWDTSTGNKAFDAISEGYYPNAEVFLLHFDITKRTTFDSLDRWLAKISRLNNKNPSIVLIGTHADKASEREVSNEEAKNFTETHALAGYIESGPDRHDKTMESVIKILNARALRLVNAKREEGQKAAQALISQGFKPYQPPKEKHFYCNFKKAYKRLWREEEREEKTIEKMIRLLDDYALGDSTLKLWCSFHANRDRTNTKEVNKIVKALKGEGLNVISTDEAFKRLCQLKVNENGSLHRRIAYMKKMLYGGQAHQKADPTLKGVNIRFLMVRA